MESPLSDEYLSENRSLATLVDGLRSTEEQIAMLEATKVAQLAAAMRIALRRMEGQHPTQRAREMELRSIAAEIGVALRWSDRVAQRRMNDALDLVERFPATVDALAAGTISARHAATIQDAGCVIPDAEDRAKFEEVVLEWAEAETVARTRDYAQGLAEHLIPESISSRFERAKQSRGVTLAELGEGIAKLEVIGPTALVHGVYNRITQQGRSIQAVARSLAAHDRESEGSELEVVDSRTLDQIRADLVIDMLLTGQPAVDPTTDTLPGGLGAIRAQVQVTIPVLTAAGKDDRGATLEGTAPIDADTARQLMAGAPGWDRVLYHPISGIVLAVDRYRASPAMERFLTARDIHCRFPGCRMPARLCDHDHNQDWALGGPTDVCNQACLCKRHHTLKTETDWVAKQQPDGSIIWTSPLQHSYVDKVSPRVAFIPDPEPPPF